MDFRKDINGLRALAVMAVVLFLFNMYLDLSLLLGLLVKIFLGFTIYCTSLLLFEKKLLLNLKYKLKAQI